MHLYIANERSTWTDAIKVYVQADRITRRKDDRSWEVDDWPTWYKGDGMTRLTLGMITYLPGRDEPARALYTDAEPEYLDTFTLDRRAAERASKNLNAIHNRLRKLNDQAGPAHTWRDQIQRIASVMGCTRLEFSPELWARIGRNREEEHARKDSDFSNLYMVELLAYKDRGLDFPSLAYATPTATPATTATEKDSA